MGIEFKVAWESYYREFGDKRNGVVALLVLLLGTLVIIPDYLLAESYPKDILIFRIIVSTVGFIGLILFRLKRISNAVMILIYAIPMFILTTYMISRGTDPLAITQQTNTLGIVGIFFIGVLILDTRSWIIISSTVILSYLLFILFFAENDVTLYLSHGGVLMLAGFLTFPIIAKVRYRLQRENYMMSYEIKCQKEDLEYYANNDLLTGVFNRRGGIQILQKAISMANRHNLALSLCFLDLNGLKAVNDSRGHVEGDRFIEHVADSIRGRVRESDTVFRFGGDEFIIIFPGCTKDEALKIISDIEGVQKDFCFGIAEYREGMTLDALINQADRSMYDNKKN